MYSNSLGKGIPLGSRRITSEDYLRIAKEVLQCIDTVERHIDKAIAKQLDANEVMADIISSDNAWLVEDTYLVMYQVVNPWYAPKEILHLSEKLVLRLKPGLDFAIVPKFLAWRQEVEGCCLTAVGTALASSDDTLASKYEQHGFRREAILLIKER